MHRCNTGDTPCSFFHYIIFLLKLLSIPALQKTNSFRNLADRIINPTDIPVCFIQFITQTMGNIGLALQLMAVGMITVFIILMIVIQLSKWLILLVNKLAPEEAASHKRQAPSATLDPQTLAVIQESVKQVTGGKGQVKKVERL